jgi:hypothetical protein
MISEAWHILDHDSEITAPPPCTIFNKNDKNKFKNLKKLQKNKKCIHLGSTGEE